MINPESALLMARAGINLNMTPQQINQALATQIQRDEVEATKNDLIAKGYTFVPFPQAGQNLATFDVGGQKLAFKKPLEEASGGGGSDTGSGSGMSSRAEQVLEGFTSISSLTPSEQQKVRDELYSLGLNSSTPPDWYREYLEDRNKLNLQGASIAPARLKTEWEKFRKQILGGGSTSSTTSESGGSGLSFDDY